MYTCLAGVLSVEGRPPELLLERHAGLEAAVNLVLMEPPQRDVHELRKGEGHKVPRVVDVPLAALAPQQEEARDPSDERARRRDLDVPAGGWWWSW